MNSSRLTAINRLLLWSLLALAAGLRMWTLTSKNLWLDESTSWDLATSSVARIIAWTATDIHPPLYYLMLKGWISLFGDSLAALRSLSVVSSVIALYLLYRLIEDAMPRIVAFAALLWCAVSPHAIYYAQETRMYAPATAAVLGACLAYRRWIDSGCSRRVPLVAYAICAAIAVYLHYFTALAIAAVWVHFVFCGGRVFRPGENHRVWRSWLIAHVAVAIAYIPWITTAFTQITHGQSWRQPVTLAEIPSYAGELVRMLTFGMYNVPYIRSVPGVLALGVLTIGFVRLVIAALKKDGEREAFFALMALAPIVLGLSLLPRSGHMDLSRYLPYAAPLMVVAGARGLSLFPWRPAHAAAALLAGTIALFPSLRAYYADPVKDSDARPIVAYLVDHARRTDGERQDTIYVAPHFMSTMVRYISRTALGYRPFDPDSENRSLDTITAEPGRTVWIIVDYRWPAFRELAGDSRLEVVDVPNGRPEMMRLFRLPAK